MSDKNQNTVSTGLKLALVAVLLLVVVVAGGFILLPMLQTVGGSFGYGYPGASGGRAIRDVEIDVEPQVVYRIDDHRFFTFEKYLDCNSGGFVYYNDTNKKIKIYAGVEGRDKEPQDEVSIMQKNNVLSFKGKFIYAASDEVIAYPDRNVSYKYGGSNYFLKYKNISYPSRKVVMDIYSSSYSVITILDDAIYAKGPGDKYEKYNIPPKKGDPEWGDSLDFKVNGTAQDDYFHCNDKIKPKRVRYIKN
ncbi:T6SS immunity protein Tli3 family protein [Erwinia sp. OPT-41]|uniref:Tli3-like domain-containing protein n=1 Tax=Erwinia plantamica TaxID=3237104 RepID=A0ABW7CG99_9GAMM